MSASKKPSTQRARNKSKGEGDLRFGAWAIYVLEGRGSAAPLAADLVHLRSAWRTGRGARGSGPAVHSWST